MTETNRAAGSYAGRPSVSPIIAGLFAAGTIARRHRILDVGCGNGTDCLIMMKWKIRRVEGIERGRAGHQARKAPCQGSGVPPDRFHCGSITTATDIFRSTKVRRSD